MFNLKGSEMNEPTNEIETGNSWGSCQYDTAANMFTMLMTHDIKAVMEKFKIIAVPRDIDDCIWARFVHDFLQVGDTVDSWADDWPYMENHIMAICENYPRKPQYAVEAMFHVCRDSSFDLWSAAPLIADVCFTKLDISNIPENGDMKGPPLNQFCQSENNNVAILCYLMTKFGFVDGTEPFTDFDT